MGIYLGDFAPAPAPAPTSVTPTLKVYGDPRVLLRSTSLAPVAVANIDPKLAVAAAQRTKALQLMAAGEASPVLSQSSRILLDDAAPASSFSLWAGVGAVALAVGGFIWWKRRKAS